MAKLIDPLVIITDIAVTETRVVGLGNDRKMYKWDPSRQDWYLLD